MEFYELGTSYTSDANLGSSQGVAFDGTYYYAAAGSASDKSVNTHLSKWTRSGDTYTLVLERDTSPDWPAGLDQINSICCHAGKLYVGGSNYATVPKEGYVFEYDPSDLTWVATHSVGENWSEGGAWHDVGSGDEFWAIAHDTTKCRRYDSSWTFVAEYELPFRSSGVDLYQGLAWIPGTDNCIAMVHEGRTPISADIFHWTGSGFVFLETLTPPTNECTQGASFETSSVLLWAERYHGGVLAQDHRIIRSEFSEVDRPTLADLLGVDTGSSQYTNLIAAWPCRPAGDTKLREISDSFDGTFVGSAGYVSSYWWDNVLNLPGSSSSYITIPSSVLASSKAAFTFTTWIKLDSSATGQIIISGNKGGSNAGDWQIGTTGTRGLSFFYNNVTTLNSSNSVYLTSNWFHLACVLTGSGAKIYVNGTEVGTNGTTGVVGGNGQILRVGLNSNDTGAMTGQVFDMRMYDIGLSSIQVNALIDQATRFSLYDDLTPSFKPAWARNASSRIIGAC